MFKYVSEKCNCSVYPLPYISPFDLYHTTGRVIAFDLDWTLVYSEHKLFPSDATDIKLFPGRLEKLQELVKDGYTIVIYTNQYSKSKKQKEMKCERVGSFIKLLKGLPVHIYIATEKDEYRKPDIGMHESFKVDYGIPITELIFVGDALGRPGDFSDSDRIFGESIGATVYSPEDFFGNSTIPTFNTKNDLVVLVGMPASGKSIFRNTYLKQHVVIEQDAIGSRSRVLSMLSKSVSNNHNQSIVIDSCNPSLKSRQEYYNLAPGYNIKIIYFLRNGTGHNNLREKPVPMIAYHMYFKKLEPPTSAEGQLFYYY